MPLATQWRALDRSAVGAAPERYGVYELGDDGDVVEVDWGVLKHELKDALAYEKAPQVRWQETYSEAKARQLAEKHRNRLD